jgi:hypothetical protein
VRARYIHEELRFERTGDVKKGLGLGKRERIEDWLEEMNVNNYIINDDLSIFLKKHLRIMKVDIRELPSYINFSVCDGYFYMGYCQLISMRGFPRHISNYFDVPNNLFKDFKGGPTYVTGSINVSNNPLLVSLKGAPTHVGGDAYMINTGLDMPHEEIKERLGIKGHVFMTWEEAHEKME